MTRRIERLDPRRHDRSSFSCGEPSLDSYLKTRASQDKERRLSTTFCLVDDADATQIIGYFTLAPGGIELSALPETLRRRLPAYPQVPVFRLGRLAVDTAFHGRGVGTELLVRALEECLGNPLNGWAVIVDALPQAKDFYRHFGFQSFVDDPDRLFMTMGDVARSLSP